MASGLGADGRSSLELTRVALARCRPVAIAAFDGPTLTLTDVSIAETGEDEAVSHHPIGAGISSPRYATKRLDQSVVYRANQTRLDATEAPLPEIPPLPRR